MMTRGARKFVFLGRSGIDRPVALHVVEDLEDAGGLVTIVRGDVSSFSDVQKSIDAVPGTLGGVCQAAMGLDVSRVQGGNACLLDDSQVRGSFHYHGK